MQDTSKHSLSDVHFGVGWWGLLFFLSMGLGLEVLHGMKMGFYLDVSNETRRHLWTLAHAHGGLISLIHIAFAATCALVPDWTGTQQVWASRALIGALVLVPCGFFFGGLFIHAGDPGLGIFLLPPGGALFFAGILLTARGVHSSKTSHS
jgi:hypothetical protein